MTYWNIETFTQQNNLFNFLAQYFTGENKKKYNKKFCKYEIENFRFAKFDFYISYSLYKNN